uniref:EamA domain-containing protein n=1 Tax=Chromera velia CCMP2878 TaxID=1169474 RepID=A0A0G4GHH4_9ALVE|eukprot:Cvel_656.t1-p1 / transcript=Cvel_656.t1 / gene=Cvel_656 / organism=Chromera_velia_CCMP2878 / gene_product=Solute carrier family 35 member F1, putative / transcript_product=Solute carrier family 35 member F1, putative / location=Cvel_scaffold20:81203-97832(-) / protein_length=574 / sequence_SO=supercontig / SO=protein_coding / is_pseudo=false
MMNIFSSVWSILSQPVLLGQVISLSSTSAGTFTKAAFHFERLSVPFSQVLLIYLVVGPASLLLEKVGERSRRRHEALDTASEGDGETGQEDAEAPEDPEETAAVGVGRGGGDGQGMIEETIESVGEGEGDETALQGAGLVAEGREVRVRGGDEQGWSDRKVWFLLGFVAFCDVHANFLSIVAFSKTSVASVMLLDCFTIPLVLLGSIFFLGCRYRAVHFCSALIALVGFGIILYADVVLQSGEGGGESGSSPEPLIGDLVALVSCLFYAGANVGQEALLRSGKVSSMSFLYKSCGIAALIALCELLLFKPPELGAIRDASGTAWALVSGSVVSTSAMYLLLPALIASAGAAFFNLSMLTSDAFSVAASVFIFGDAFSLLYVLGFAVVISAVCAFHLVAVEYPSDSDEQRETAEGETEERGGGRDGEGGLETSAVSSIPFQGNGTTNGGVDEKGGHGKGRRGTDGGGEDLSDLTHSPPDSTTAEVFFRKNRFQTVSSDGKAVRDTPRRLVESSLPRPRDAPTLSCRRVESPDDFCGHLTPKKKGGGDTLMRISRGRNGGGTCLAAGKTEHGKCDT